MRRVSLMCPFCCAPPPSAVLACHIHPVAPVASARRWLTMRSKKRLRNMWAAARAKTTSLLVTVCFLSTRW
jgi:hypothetical protein